jgi:hypothetical protein
VPRFVAGLRRELARLAHFIAIALDLLLRLREVALGGLQAARRELGDLRFVGLRDHCARFVEDTALDRDQLRLAQQDFGLGRTLLGILRIVLFVRRHRLAEALGGLLPRLPSKLRRLRSECVFARLDHRAKQLPRACGGGRRAAQCRFTFLNLRTDLVGFAAFGSIFRRCLLSLDGRREVGGRKRIHLFAARLVDRSRKRGCIDVLCSMSDACQRQQANHQSTQTTHVRTCPEPRTTYL